MKPLAWWGLPGGADSLVRAGRPCPAARRNRREMWGGSFRLPTHDQDSSNRYPFHSGIASTPGQSQTPARAQNHLPYPAGEALPRSQERDARQRGKREESKRL